MGNWGWTSEGKHFLIDGQNGKLKWADIRSLTQSLMSWYCFSNPKAPLPQVLRPLVKV